MQYCTQKKGKKRQNSVQHVRSREDFTSTSVQSLSRDEGCCSVQTVLVTGVKLLILNHTTADDLETLVSEKTSL